jgi:ABC-type enterochelin transport system permease subunit
MAAVTRTSSSSMAVAADIMVSLGTSRSSSSMNWVTNGRDTASNTGIILRVVITCLIIWAALVPAATPP